MTLLGLAIAVFAIGLDGYIVAAVLPAIADDLHESIAAVGLLVSAYSLPTALLAPAFGPLCDRRGRRFALTLGLAVFAAAGAACAVAPSLPPLLLFNGSAINLGFVVGPMVAGRVIESTGFGVGAPWAASLGLLALGVAWLVLPRRLAAAPIATPAGA